MSQAEKANRFGELHRPGSPLVLFNIWDAGSARAVVDAGAPAVATGSWSVAAAQGYEDGQELPLELLRTLAGRICASVDVPVSIDFEGGYATDPEAVAENVRQILRAGAVGINFEDRVVGGEGLHPIRDQVAKIEAIKAMAAEEAVSLFLNARTDLFLENGAASHKDVMAEAKERGAAYAGAGADGFFVPGLVDFDLIGDIVNAVDLPVNVLKKDGMGSVGDLATVGVSRISHGPAPYRQAMSDLVERFKGS
ncbi:isocitrate lyase/PEP mutase family protein [Palleronia caenipelagi]|uniref:Isocitrate lyase/phosphoenolpyruvate mutase family protein n=1 Tax=Palleronia caenipelagi TaxID=2489174 RepID=A0A547PKX3_9RHOB|nr:isocitrate lyase/phosphoenolpyruvate mutase family protein [Palleronia caenipelagi]TRD14800.1 isocitrate lyase/phosphoenolpyruvate mutase family protein [Palleronia caenipelagi]